MGADSEIYHDDFPESPLRSGNKVLIRSVTHYWVGEIVRIGAHEILIKDSSWIPSTGRWNEVLSTGKLDEVEITPGYVAVMKGAVVDVVFWNHPLPTESK